MSWSKSLAGKKANVVSAVRASEYMAPEVKEVLAKALDLFPERHVLLETSGHLEASGGMVEIRIKNVEQV